MIKLIDRYIGIVVLKSIVTSLVFLTILRMVFLLIDDLPNIGRGHYQMYHALFNLALNAPSTIYNFFPMATLIGAISGLGFLAGTNELLVIRASGVSVKQILAAVLMAVMPLMIAVILLGEVISPISTQYAQKQHSLAISGGQVIRSKSGVWARDSDDFIHIGRATPDGRIENFERYSFDQNFKLKAITKANSGQYQQRGYWILNDISISEFLPGKVESKQLKQQQWKSQLNPENIGVVGSTPAGLGLIELWIFSSYLEDNKLDSSKYRLAFWRSVLQPFVIVVMLFLGASFVFGSVRHVAMGTRILGGVLLGLGFYVINETLGNVAVVYQMPPLIGALLPLLTFFAIAWWRLSRIR